LAGTEIDRTSDINNTYIEVGKTYSGTFAVSGVLSGNEQEVMDSVSDMIQYPANHPEAYGICIPTYISVDSSTGVAYAEWKVDEAVAGSYRAEIAPIALAVIVIAILSIGAIILWLISIVLQKATEFIAAAGPDFTWIAIAIAGVAVAGVLVAAVYAYGKVVSDRPIMSHYNDYRNRSEQNYE
jgi:hypothetical protein